MKHTDYAMQGRAAQLKEERAAALVKIDRELQALEDFGRQRVMSGLETVGDELDLTRLFGIVADLGEAKATYDRAAQQLARL